MSSIVVMFMPDEIVKPRRIWVYLSAVDQTRLEELMKKFSNPAFGEVEILSIIASAGLKACDDAGGVMPLPLQFHLGELRPGHEFRMNEPKGKGRK